MSAPHDYHTSGRHRQELDLILRGNSDLIESGKWTGTPETADDFPEVFGPQLRPAPLTALSLVRATAGVPPTPSNIDRRRAFREVQPVACTTRSGGRT